MGASASCSFELSPTDKPVYWAGETVSGHVLLTVKKSLKVKSISVNMVGQLVYREVRTCGNQGSQIVVLRRDIFGQNRLLSIPATNDISSGKDGYSLQPNTYRCPFSIHLPEDLPPSVPHNNGDYPYIKYVLSCVVHRSWPHFDLSSSHRILVTPRVPIPKDVQSLQMKKVNLGDLQISGILQRNYLLIGQAIIPLVLDIKNPNHMTIERITVAFTQHRQFAGAVGNSIIFSHPLSDMIDVQEEHLHRTFQIPVAAPDGFLPPTSSYTKSGNNSRSWTIHYVLTVTFYTQAVSRNVTLEFALPVANTKL